MNFASLSASRSMPRFRAVAIRSRNRLRKRFVSRGLPRRLCAMTGPTWAAMSSASTSSDESSPMVSRAMPAFIATWNGFVLRFASALARSSANWRSSV